ncbi:hypothetical protein [Cognatishimia maritima]|nr:hypothetical protein [Cognatishimia maritima]
MRGSIAGVATLGPDEGVSWLAIGVYLIAQTFSGTWVAVAWHRYVLQEDDSGAIIPSFMGRRVGAYFMQGVLIAIIVGIVTVVAAAALFFAFSGLNSLVLAIVLPLVIALVGLWLFYRVSPALPAVAIEEALSIGDAWRATRPYSGSILVLVIAMAAASGVFGALVELTVESSTYLYLVLVMVQTWISMMVGISVLTTIYGVVVENRDF